MAGPIRIAILANAAPAVNSMREVSESATSMGKRMSGVGKAMAASMAAAGAAVAATGIVTGFKKAIDEAASLSAAVGATKQVFKGAADGMLKWSESAAVNLGLSQSEALNATKVFGGFFTAVGMNTREAAGMSQQWATMAGNLAAFADLPTADAIDSITGALRGELDPLQKYIPTISAAAIEQEAMAQTGKKNAKALTAQEKAAAINALLMDSVANKAGAAERAQGGYAVQTEKLKAQTKDFAATIGGLFLPALTDGMAFVNDKAIPALKDFGKMVGPKLSAMFDSISGFKPPKALIDLGKSQEASAIVAHLKSGMGSLLPTFKDAFARLAPIFASLREGIGTIFTASLPRIRAILATIATIVGQAFEYIRTIIATVVSAIQFIWQKFGADILAYLSTAFAGVIAAVQGALTIISGIFDVIIGLLTGNWGRAWDGIKAIVSGAWQFIFGIFTVFRAQAILVGQVVKAALIGAWNAIKAATVAVWNAIRATLSAAWQAIKNTIAAGVAAIGALIAAGWNAVKSATAAAWGAVRSSTSAAWNAIKGAVAAAWGAIRGAVAAGGTAVKNAIVAAWAAVKTATVTAWNNVKTAVTTGVTNAVSAVKALPGKITGALSGAASWLVDVGRDMIQGMINGVEQKAGALIDKAKSVVRGAIDGAKSMLGIASPSKKFMELGRLSVAGLIDGLETGRDDIKRTVTDLIDAVLDAFPTSIEKTFPKGTKLSVIEKWKEQEKKAGKKRIAKRNELLERITADNKALLRLAARRDAVAEQLRAATEHLADLRADRANVASSVADVFTQAFRLIDTSAEAGVATIDSIIQRSRDALAQAKQFAGSLEELASRGVAPEVLRELAMAGPQAGMDTAKALLRGSADQLKELNANYQQIADTGKSAGELIAGHMYDTGIAAAKRLADGFASQQAYLEASILQMIDDLNKKIAAAVAAVTPKTPKVETNKPIPVAKPGKGKKGAKGELGKAAPAVTSESVSVTVNTGVVVDKRGMVDAISAAFNEVSDQLGRPIAMKVVA